MRHEVQHCFQIKGTAGFSSPVLAFDRIVWTVELSFFVVLHVLKLGPVLGCSAQKSEQIINLFFCVYSFKPRFFFFGLQLWANLAFVQHAAASAALPRAKGFDLSLL